MKKITTIAILFMSSFAFAQIKVIETVPVEKLGRVNNFYVQKIGEEYSVFYNTVQNAEEASTIKSFSFKNVDNAYASFYNIITTGFAANPLYDIKLELPNNYVWLHYTVNFDKSTSVQFMVSNKENTASNVSEPLSREQVEKLFQRS